jgi:outer membrane protein TolC
MNRLYNLSRNAALSAIAFVSMTFVSGAQNSAEVVLASVEKNNPELQALRKRTESEKYGFKAERMVEAPEVGFDYLWGSPADIGTRKDISVTQSIDIATISGTKGKIAKSESELSDMQFNVRRQEILLQAKLLYINIIYCNAVGAELERRLERSEKVESVYRDMQVRGETDMIEVNKAHLAYLAQRNALARNKMEAEGFRLELQRLNGGEPLEINDLSYVRSDMLPADFDTWYKEVADRSPEIRAARQNVKVNEAVARGIKMSSCPTITAGYMAELVKGSNFRGLTLGLSIPLWSARSKTRQANLSCEASRLEVKDVEASEYSALRSLYEKASGLKDLSDELALSLAVSDEAMSMTEKKFNEGEISLMDSIMELSLYYSVVDESLAASKDYDLALAELNAWSL